MPRNVKTVPSLPEILRSLATESHFRFRYGRRKYSLYQARGLRKAGPGTVDVLMETTPQSIPEVMRYDYLKSEACLLNDDAFELLRPEAEGSRKVITLPKGFDRLTLIAWIMRADGDNVRLDSRNGENHLIPTLVVFGPDMDAKVVGELVDQGRKRVLLHGDFSSGCATLRDIKVPDAKAESVAA